jgi:formylglycine-generating enzyme required for sulfatase activity
MTVRANCQALSGYRLPREAEWEYACRAGTVTAWSHGSDEALLGQYAWYYTLNSSLTMHPVGALKPNGLGLFDVHGNAWQWCHDTYDGNDTKHNETIRDKAARVLHGGSFMFDAGYARSAVRDDGVGPEFWNGGTGFRVARTIR